jgi:hypothetical protein
MKNILFFLLTTLFACNSTSTPTESLLKELNAKFGGLETDANDKTFYMKSVKYEKGFLVPEIKGIVDKNLNSTETSKHENYSLSDSPDVINSYEWDLPKFNVKMESSFNGELVTYKFWITNK